MIKGIYNISDMTITEAKAAAVRRFAEMQANEWQALESMTDDELDALKQQVDESGVILDVGHPHNETRIATYRAISRERARRYREASRRREQQTKRQVNVNRAVQLIDEARKLVEAAYNIEPMPDALSQSPSVPDVDIATATDDELDRAFTICQTILNERNRDAVAYAQSIATLKGKAAKAIADELKLEAEMNERRKATASAMLDLIASERERRESERHAEAEALKPESMAARIAELERALNFGTRAD